MQHAKRHRLRILVRPALLVRLLAVMSLAGAPARAQSDLPHARGDALKQPPAYLPLEAVRTGRVRTPAPLARRVSVHHVNALLPQVLVDIATQAGLGLSYGEDLVRAGTRVSIDFTGSAADALAVAADTSVWRVFVTATGQVSVRVAVPTAAATVEGRVTDRSTHDPVVSAQLSIEGTLLTALSGADGRFRINDVPDGPQRLTAKRLGYVAQTLPINVAPGVSNVVDLELTKSVAALSEVVVTAAGTERTRSIGNSVTILDVASEREPVATTQQLLVGRVPGVTVLGNSGQPGTGGTIRLRGVNSISQGNAPIIYVDGVRIANGATPTNVSARQDVLPLNDVDVTDIERIEVVKGPAATTLYGTEASGGVIQIFTKRGQQGPAQWTADVTTGFNNMGHVGPSSDPTGLFVNKCGGTLMIGDSTRFQDASCPASGSWLRNGMITRYSLGVRGATGNVDYYLAGNLNNEQSVLQVGGNKYSGVRGNITVKANPSLTLALNSSFEKRDVTLFPDGLSSNGFLLNVSRGSGSAFKGPGCSDPTVVCLLNDSLFNTTNTNSTNHFITGGTATFAPNERFTTKVSAGYDYNAADIIDITPFGYLRVPLGQMFETQWSRTLITFDLASTYRQSFGSAFLSTTSVGAQVFDNQLNSTDLSATNFAGPGLPTLTSGALRSIDNVTDQRVINAGWFAQETIGWRDRLFVTAGLRVDGNSAFGKSFGLETYPKLSVAYVLSDNAFWPRRWIESFKLRGAIGESGKAPGAFDAVRTWNPVAAENGKSAFEPAQIGNPNLGPERTREIEAGFDASAFDGRLTLSYSYYTQRTSAALVPVTLPPSLGFSSQQLENVGELRNNGSEVALSARVLERRRLSLDLGLQVTLVRSEAGNLGGQTITIDANSLSFVQQGLPAPSYIADKVTNPTAFADPVIVHNAFLGGTFPNSIVSPRVTLRLWNRLTLDAFGEFQRGGHLLNAIGFANEGLKSWQPCYDIQNKLKAAAAGNTAALSDVNALDRARCAIDPNIRNGGFWVEATDFFKLRNVSLTYDLPDRLVGASKKTSITISGQNLFKSTNYTGTDPESADQRISSFSRRDYYVFPAPRTILFSVHTSY